MLSFIYCFVLQIIFINCSVKAIDSTLNINTDLMTRIADDNKLNIGLKINNKQNLLSNKVENHLNVNNTKSLPKLTDDNANHVCLREEQYIEEVRIPSKEPVRIRSSTWCMEFPPRCSNYKTEMREVIKVQNLTKTRTIRFCCVGYEGNISINDTICKPVCRGGCGRGYCMKPDICSCEPGYMGKHCTHRCDHDHWGLNCFNVCQCLNGAVCDNKSGLCHCTTGWTGNFCEKTCPSGTHGVMCRKVCECENKQCNPQTGACAVESASNETHVFIANLNSTIANITNNLDRLAKNINNIAGNTTNDKIGDILEATTPKPEAEVFVIKQEDAIHGHTPKIIVHQAGTGLFDNLQNGVKTSEVIHVITNGLDGHNNRSRAETMEMAGFANIPVQKEDHLKVIVPQSQEHETNLLSMILIILLVVLVAIALGFLYVYRRYHIHKAQVETALAARSMSLVPGVNTPVIIAQPPPSPTSAIPTDLFSIFPNSTGSLSKSFAKPLPDLPAFTQMVRNKIEGPDLYDIPDHRISTNVIPPKKYGRKESLYSVIMPKSRKPSMDSHLYDEIPYTISSPIMSTTIKHNLMPPHHDLHAMNHYTRAHNQGPLMQGQISQHQQQQQYQPSQQTQIIDQGNGIFLQVPTSTTSTHQANNFSNIAHI